MGNLNAILIVFFFFLRIVRIGSLNSVLGARMQYKGSYCFVLGLTKKSLNMFSFDEMDCMELKVIINDLKPFCCIHCEISRTAVL